MELLALNNSDISMSEESAAPTKLALCVFCRRITPQFCKRCGDPYCSEKCQLIDWQKHRYICFPIPALVPAKNSVFTNEDVFPTEPPIGDCDKESMILNEFRTLKNDILKKMDDLKSSMDDKFKCFNDCAKVLYQLESLLNSLSVNTPNDSFKKNTARNDAREVGCNIGYQRILQGFDKLKYGAERINESLNNIRDSDGVGNSSSSDTPRGSLQKNTHCNDSRGSEQINESLKSIRDLDSVSNTSSVDTPRRPVQKNTHCNDSRGSEQINESLKSIRDLDSVSNASSVDTPRRLVQKNTHCNDSRGAERINESLKSIRDLDSVSNSSSVDTPRRPVQKNTHCNDSHDLERINETLKILEDFGSVIDFSSIDRPPHGAVKNKTHCNDSRGAERMNDSLKSIRDSDGVGNSTSIGSAALQGNSSRSECVLLYTFTTTNRCAVRKKNRETDIAYREIIDQIHKYGQDAPEMETLPEPGSYAVTLKSFKLYTRVKVINVESKDKIRVMFCDFGNTVLRKLSDLRVLSPEMANLPELVTPVQLYGVRMKRYNESMIEFMKKLERKEYRMETVSDTGVNLYDIESGELLNDVVDKFYTDNVDSPKIPRQHRSSKSKSAVMKPPFESHIFAPGLANVKAVILDTTLVEHGYMACILSENMNNLSEIQRFLKDMDLGKTPYEPKNQEYCVALFDGEWYRGLVIDIVRTDDETKFEISYIDFLNEAILKSKDIRPYPKDLKIPCYTTLCKIDGLPKKLTQEHQDYLTSELTVNKTININRVVGTIDGKIALIECVDIMDDMHKKKLV